HLSLKEYDRAENYFKKALEVDPKMALAQFGLARLYKVQKRDDLYKTHLAKAKELDPDNPYFNDEEPKKKK
ncbi:MAG: tetratricopeptide repeat protein, partial [Fibrobacter sp.]|nr:tetratricopeptide repeat protein [Fibrobacter sp.]